ncbi:MAG: amidase [Caulobacteraceae bacterium]|nr:amidase [Caulobacteraceae bacterium]
MKLMRPMLVCAAFVALCLSPPAVAEPRARDAHRDLSDITVAQLHRLYARRELKVVDVVSWHLARIAALNPRYRAYVRIYGPEALRRAAWEDRQWGAKRARALLWGVPIVIKDNTAIRDHPLTNGWEGYALAKAPMIARRDATVVRRLRAAGAIILGHSNMPDFARSDTTVSSLGGRTGNAYDIDFSPGGSSGGSAVAVALGMAVIGQGSDTGNSIRNPASNNGLVGVVPTRGLVSTAGVHPYDWLRDNTGPLARTVTDAAIALDAMAGRDPLDPRTEARRRPAGDSFLAALKPGALKGRRFGVPRFILEGSPTLRPMPNYWNRGVSPETRSMFMAAVEQLRAAGATVVIDEQLMPESFDGLAKAIQTRPYRADGVDRFLARYAPARLGSIKRYEQTTGRPYPMDLLADGEPQARFADGRLAYERRLESLRRAYRETMRRYRLDGLVYPALQVPPNDERLKLPADYPSDGPYSATSWVNLLGLPAVVLPAGRYANGLPFGLEISAPRWRDAALLSYAYAYERSARLQKPPALAGFQRSALP